MLPLVIVWPIKTGSFANGHGSIGSRNRHVIVIKRHRVIGRLIVIVPSFFPLLRDFLFEWGLTIFAWGGVCFAFLLLCLKLLVLSLELLKASSWDPPM
jgi:hypothetical protein